MIDELRIELEPSECALDWIAWVLIVVVVALFANQLHHNYQCNKIMKDSKAGVEQKKACYARGVKFEVK